MVIWVLYKRFKNIWPREKWQHYNTKYDKNKNVRTGKSSSFFVVVDAALLLLLRFVVASLCLCSDGYVLRFDRKRFCVLTASVVFFVPMMMVQC